MIETGLGNDAPAIIGDYFDEDMPAYVDRAHQHNGAAFDSATGRLSTIGDLIVPLPEYLVGHPYVLFANDARDNSGYSAIITTDEPSIFYLLIDNRINGANQSIKENTTDPILEGSLQWVADGGWVRMNTGISPNGQADYTAIDEGGDGYGPGEGLNNFMAVYRYPTPAMEVTVSNYRIGGNMLAVVVVPAPTVVAPIEIFAASPVTIDPGQSSTLNWLINPAATGASIDQGVGNVLPLSNENGAGTVTVSPLTDTTYTLSVTVNGATTSATATVKVSQLATFRSSHSYIFPGEKVTLSWRVRPDATVSLEGPRAPATVQTNADGFGSAEVQPDASATYTLTATAGDQVEQAPVGVAVWPPGPSFALLDFGLSNSRPEPGAANGRAIGIGTADTNQTDLPETEVLADTGDVFLISMDALDPDGFPDGGLDWRDRGDGPTAPLCRLVEDFVKNNRGIIRVVLSNLPAGTYDVVSYHLDPSFSQCSEIRILVTDARGEAVDTGVVGDASFEGHPSDEGAPTLAGLHTGLVASKEAKFQIVSNGTDDVIIYFDGRWAPYDTEVTLGALRLTLPPPRPPDDTYVLFDIGATTGQPELGAAGGIVLGGGESGVNGLDMEPVTVPTVTGELVSLALDALDPEGFVTGGLDWRDRGNAAEVPMARLAEDLVKNNSGLIHATITGLPAGTYEAISYHLDPDFSQAEYIRILVRDASTNGEVVDTGVIGDASFPNGDGDAPRVAGLNTGVMLAKGARFTITSDGSNPVEIWFDGREGADMETPLAGLRLLRSAPPVPEAAEIAVTAVGHVVEGESRRVEIRFVSTPGKTYKVLASPDLRDWSQVVAPNVPAGDDGTGTFVDTVPLTTTHRYYRIQEN